MALAELLAWGGTLFTVFMGLGGLLMPGLAQRIAHVGPLPGYPKAVAEIRAGFGGIYVGLGFAVIAALIAGNGVVGASFAAALAWLGLALGRAVSMIADRAANRWNWTSLCIEAGVGLMLLAPFIAHIEP